MLPELTLIVPFYRNTAMLKRQVEEWNLYLEAVRIILVDDGSPEPALPIIEQHATPELRRRLQVYRILVDKPWNRGMARNLGSFHAETYWIVHFDIDHILPAESVPALVDFNPDVRHWYRFPRWRRGRADDTRRKDAIPETQEYGQIHPHVDSYLVRKDIYWESGGYDEDFSGGLGGGTPFLRRLEALQSPRLLPDPIRLEVYTRSVIADASDRWLSRDTAQYQKLRRSKEDRGFPKPKDPLRLPWAQVL